MAELRSERIAALIKARGLNQSEVARRVGISQPSIGRLITGETRESGKLLELARALETTPEYLVGETDDPSVDAVGEKRLSWTPPIREINDDTVEIDQVDVSYGMGAAFIEGHIEAKKVRLSRAFLRYFTDTPPEFLFIGTGVGDSMAPTIQSYEPVIVDRSKTSLLVGDKIWAAAYGQTGIIKRLRPMPDGSVKILSDNPLVPPETAYDGELHIIGMVVGKGTKL